MDFDEYRREADRLYREYLKLLQNADGVISLPTATCRLPGSWRPQFEKFEFIANLLDAPDEITKQIEELKQEVLVMRSERIKALEEAFPRKVVATSPPSRKDGKRKEYAQVIQTAELALAICRDSGPRLSTYLSHIGPIDTRDDIATKNAERIVRQYHAHAEMLKKAAANGTFFDALLTPLPKK